MSSLAGILLAAWNAGLLTVAGHTLAGGDVDRTGVGFMLRSSVEAILVLRSGRLADRERATRLRH